MSAETVVLVDYGAGNLKSAENALREAARRCARDVDVHVTAAPEEVLGADRIVLPGVGAFASCRAGLDAAPGLVEALTEKVRVRGAPFLGVCVGLQLLADAGLEHGRTPGLGWLPGEVRALTPADPATQKLPHMGWNALARTRGHPVTDAAPDGAYVYFVHSYALDLAEPGDALATADHGGAFVAAAGRDNMVGMQFHPEKSQAVGLALLAKFLEWRP